MAVYIDKREKEQHSLNPYFEAGEQKPFLNNRRNEGTSVSAAGFVDALGDDVAPLASGANVAIVSQGASGIQGFTKYQASVDMLVLPL